MKRDRERWVVRIEARYEPLRAPRFVGKRRPEETVVLRRRIHTILHRYGGEEPKDHDPGMDDPPIPNYAILYEPEPNASTRPFFRIEFLYPSPREGREVFMGVTPVRAKGTRLDAARRVAALAYLGGEPPRVIVEHREDIIPLESATDRTGPEQTLSVHIGIREEDPREFELFFDLVLPRWLNLRPPRLEDPAPCVGGDQLFHLVRAFSNDRKKGALDCEETRSLDAHFASYKVPYLEKRLHLHVHEAKKGRLYGIHIAAPVIEEIIATQGWPMDGLEPVKIPMRRRRSR